MFDVFSLLNHKTEATTDEEFANSDEMIGNNHVYICTTMYHENEKEMEQLLTSIAKVDKANTENNDHFEAHIFFDNGVEGKTKS